MQYFLVVLITIIVFLMVLLLLTGGKFSSLIGYFVEELDENNAPLHPVRLALFQGLASKPHTAANVRKTVPIKPPAKAAASRPRTASKQGTRRNPNQAYTEMAILTHKIDERRRVVDSTGHSTLYDEYFELVFETRRGETLRLVAPRAAFKETPFNQDGAVTYKHGRLIRFKYAGGIVSGETVSTSSK